MRFAGLYGQPPSCSQPLPSKSLSSSLRAAAYPTGPEQLLGNGGWALLGRASLGVRYQEQTCVCREGTLPPHLDLGYPSHTDVPEALSPAPGLPGSAVAVASPQLVTGLFPAPSSAFAFLLPMEKRKSPPEWTRSEAGSLARLPRHPPATPSLAQAWEDCTPSRWGL